MQILCEITYKLYKYLNNSMKAIAQGIGSLLRFNGSFNRFCTEKSGSNPQRTGFEIILENNKRWARENVEREPDFFSKLVNIQTPKYLWIGCSDSRVPANQIMGLKPGEVFVHRNIANIVPPSDINVMAVIQYAVEHLKVEDIIVSGHYGCGGVKAAFSQNDYGPLESWLSYLRELRGKYRNNLIGSNESRIDSLVELNVIQQVVNVARIPIVQQAWKANQKLCIHGVVYNLQDGILKDLGVTLSEVEHLPQQFQISKAPIETQTRGRQPKYSQQQPGQQEQKK